MDGHGSDGGEPVPVSGWIPFADPTLDLSKRVVREVTGTEC